MAFCPKCGAPHDPGDKFCAGCGNNLTAPNPAPQNPAPQQPQYAQYQAPQQPQYAQYQAPQQPQFTQYQAPQQPQYAQYQAPQFSQPTPYFTAQPQVRIPAAPQRTAVKKAATAALILAILALVFEVVGVLIYVLSPQLIFNFTFRSVLSTLLPFLIAAALPVVTLILSSRQGSKPSGVPFLITLILLALQVVSAIAIFVTYVAAVRTNFENAELYYKLSSLLRYIPGVYTGSDLFSVIRRLVSLPFRYWLRSLQDSFFWINIANSLNGILYLVSSVISISAAGKLKKS